MSDGSRINDLGFQAKILLRLKKNAVVRPERRQVMTRVAEYINLRIEISARYYIL